MLGESKHLQKKRKAYIYVDGFNLYYRKLEANPPLKWLDLRRLFEKCVYPNDEIVSVKYFTAEVDPHTSNTLKKGRQKAYWSALRSTGVEIVAGRLERRERRCKAQCGQTYPDMAEKMTDVNLALHVYKDFIENRPDLVCILSADLDVIPPLHMIRKVAACAITILLPNDDQNVYWSRSRDCGFARLRQVADEWLVASQLPDCVTSPDGVVTRPPEWA